MTETIEWHHVDESRDGADPDKVVWRRTLDGKIFDNDNSGYVAPEILQWAVLEGPGSRPDAAEVIAENLDDMIEADQDSIDDERRFQLVRAMLEGGTQGTPSALTDQAQEIVDCLRDITEGEE